MIRHRTHLPSSSQKAALLRSGALSLAVLLTALIGFATQAQAGYPKAKDPYVNDFAKILTAKDAITIRTALAKLRDGAGVQAVVVTIRSIHGYGTGDQTIESFATNLFNKWGIGDRERNDGVLILVAVKDRKVRIELGSGYGGGYNAQMQGVIDQQMLPHFKEKNYSLGILEGTDSVVQILSGRAAPTALPYGPTPEPTVWNSGASSTSDSVGAPLFLVIVGVVIAAAIGLILRARFGKRRCPSCRIDMARLYGGAEDQYLDDGQKLEKSLGSVEYEVWQCPKCGIHDLKAQYRWFSSFAGCHSCGYRTMKVGELITVHPTEFSPGEKQIDKECYRCGFRRCEAVILPPLPQHTQSSYSHSQHSAFGANDFGSGASSSSGFDSGGSSFDSGSSSGGSFDGGSSSGDGASGSW
jgi:uncharacterized protein